MSDRPADAPNAIKTVGVVTAGDGAIHTFEESLAAVREAVANKPDAALVQVNPAHVLTICDRVVADDHVLSVQRKGCFRAIFGDRPTELSLDDRRAKLERAANLQTLITCKDLKRIVRLADAQAPG